MPTQQLSKHDWTEAALAALGRGGVSAVRVDVLAKRFGVTRGSFYWHFSSRDALIAAAMEEWERSVTTDTIDRLDAIASPTERLREILRIAFYGSPTPAEPAIAADGDHPIIAPVLRRVVAARIAFVTDIYVELGLDKSEARRRALVIYSAFTGWLQLRRAVPDVVPEVSYEGRRAARFVDHLAEVSLAGIDTPPA